MAGRRRAAVSSCEAPLTSSALLCSQVLGLKLPNVFGRAEKLTFQFSYGTKETSYGLSFFKPQPGNFERKYDSMENAPGTFWNPVK